MGQSATPPCFCLFIYKTVAMHVVIIWLVPCLSSTNQHLHRKGLTSIPSTLQPLEGALLPSPLLPPPAEPKTLVRTGLAQSPFRAPHFIKSKAQTVVYTILHDPTHLPSTSLAPCSYVPATLTNLFREHTCLRAFALAAFLAWNVPPRHSCLTHFLSTFKWTGKEIFYSPYLKL